MCVAPFHTLERVELPEAVRLAVTRGTDGSSPRETTDERLQPGSSPDIGLFRRLSGCGSMVERGLPKPETRVRFPSPAPLITKGFGGCAAKVQ